MSTPLRLDYAVNDADVIAAFKRQQTEMEKERKARQELEKTINSNAAAQKSADKAAAESSKEAAAVAAKYRTEEQKTAAEIAKVNKLREEGALSAEDHAQAIAQLTRDLKAEEKAARDATAAEKAQSAVLKEAAAVVAKFSTEQQKNAAELRRVKELYEAGALSVEQYDQAVAELTRDVRAEAEAERKNNDQMKQAQAIINSLKTPQEKYQENLKKLKALHDSGKLSASQYAAAQKQEGDALADSAKSSDAFGGSLGGLAGKMATAVGGFVSMQAVIGFLKAEYDALIERQGKSRDANISLAAEQEALIGNLGGVDAEKAFESVRKLSRDSGVKEENVTRAVNEAMAARGDLDVQAVIDAVGSVSKIRKFAPSEMAGLAAATIDTQKQTGLGTDESLGFLHQMQAQSRVKNLKGLAENFTPGVGGVMKMGADRETAGAMLAALSHGMGDTSGAQTRTTGISLATQLRKFSGGKGVGETITMLQADPEMRAAFLKTASFEAQALPAIESLLSSGGTQAKQYAAAKEALKANPLDMLKSAVDARAASPSIGIAERDQSLANITDQQRLMDTGGAESATARERLREQREQSGGWGMVNSAKGMLEDATSGGQQTTAGALDAMQAELARKKAGQTDTNTILTGGNPLMMAAMRSFSKGDPEEQKQIKALEELIALTKLQLAAQQAANAAQQNKAHAGLVGARANNQGEAGR